MTQVARSPLAGSQRTSIGDRMDRLPVTALHRSMTAFVGAGLFFDYFDSNLSGTVSKVLQTQFAVGGTTLMLFLASGFIGQFVGSLVLGRLSDRLGRRRAFMLNLLTYSLFTLAGAFSPSAGWLIVTRFLAGLGIGAEQTLADCYLAEVLPPAKRGRLIAWAYSLAFCGVPAVGFTALWLAPRSWLGVAGWRWVFVAGALGTVAVWLLRRGLIESPRWLAARGRIAEADQLVRRLERQAGVVSEPLAPVAAAGVDRRPPGYRVLFSAGQRGRTLVLWTVCLLSVVAYYGFGTLAPQVLAVKGVDVVSGLGYTALTFLGYPFGSLLTVPVIDRVERRVLICGAAVLMAASGLGFGLSADPVAVVVFGFLYTLLSNVFSTASHVFLAEQYPTEFRTTATGAAYSLSRLGAGVLPFVMIPILQHGGAGLLFTVIAGAMAVLVVVVGLFGQRTTGLSVDRHDQLS
ncbi:MFS transporter [Actinoplanes teichomyceticus]|uniref:Putative MFS transporter n=1 Tax=Actinoplanes teichomyceticus TaxID=1867 RepID=A0A561WLQ5_ACTTI|nr:MFS transporter [Actinoplanes teichomyceticus]TWG24796.1 putative MFS transporter [Actinoplanes teichomyceticus]GIF14542.1 MFS transporter [Actinoplanes teichomyceticus]